jgi:hypothetical protein
MLADDLFQMFIVIMAMDWLSIAVNCDYNSTTVATVVGLLWTEFKSCYTQCLGKYFHMNLQFTYCHNSSFTCFFLTAW